MISRAALLAPFSLLAPEMAHLDLARGAAGALGQGPHLGGHHRKAPARLAGARGFDRGVQRQDVGLERDAVDGADDLGDALRRLADLAHALGHVAGGLAAALGHCGGLARHLCGRLCGVGRLADGAGDLLHRRRRLLQVAGLGFGARAEVVVALGNLAGRQRDAFHFPPHIAHDGLQIDVELGEAAVELTHFVLPVGGHHARQIASRHAPHRGHGVAHRHQGQVAQPGGHARAHQQADGCRRAHAPLGQQAGRQAHGQRAGHDGQAQPGADAGLRQAGDGCTQAGHPHIALLQGVHQAASGGFGAHGGVQRLGGLDLATLRAVRTDM